jgi:adenylosuccinate synthase
LSNIYRLLTYELINAMLQKNKMQKEYFGKAIAIVGGQFGSEGKGAIAEYLAPLVTTTVRIGASNAGHTVFYNRNPYVMRTIPCGWINLSTKLVLGISAVISLQILLDEIKKIDAILPIRHRLFIDPHAHVITDDQIHREMQTGLAERISSTSAKSGLGIGMAMSDKVLRSGECRHALDIPELQEYICDTVELLNHDLEDDQIVVFEGTQGFGLSLEHGFYPYTTSRDTTAQALFEGTGVNPYPFDIEVIGVFRAYPIRVGGPSGIFNPDSVELTWDDIAKLSGSLRDVTEKTSVTKSIRRVATFSTEGLKRACMVNRVSEIALTFADHIDARVYEQETLTEPVLTFIEKIESETGIPVGLVKTGPTTIIDRDWYRSSMLRKIA